VNVKQVIVIRRDLKMRRGKEIAQGAHASMAWLTERLRTAWSQTDPAGMFPSMGQLPSFREPEAEWIKGLFTKVVVQVPGEIALLDLYQRVRDAGIEVHLIEDAGLTEFGGKPTFTALGIGPDLAEKLDPFTRTLELY
jgi:PTH2 family peptidyl-tRNA hydrolase